MEYYIIRMLLLILYLKKDSDVILIKFNINTQTLTELILT